MASISSLFGYILNFIYNLVQNYGLSIIIFSILLKLVLLPISIKQQKTMKKTAKIQGKVKEIQDKYKNDPQKMNQEMMDLYKKENMSPFSGCLSSIIQIILLLAMFGLVRNPLTYMLKIDQNTVNNVANYIKQESEENKIDKAYPQISILKYVSKNSDKTIDLNSVKDKKKTTEENVIENSENIENVEENITESENNNVEKNELNLKDLYINMNFAGLDLSNVPRENWQDPTVFVIPVLYVLTSMISMKLTTMMTKNNNKKDIIEIENENTKKEDELNPEDMTAQMSKSMTWFMPLMSVSISLIAPLGLALYWLVNNILMIIERLVLNKVLKSEGDE
ncbi:MAG: membrane protein insertase YidC [Clostridia bacterium]|nr:membrane protein insertase YidC [Clostridia bacterium]